MNPDTYDKEQYEKGKRIGEEAQFVCISRHGVWSAKMKDGGYLQSFERIGYHKCTESLYQGFIDSRCEMKIHKEFLNV